MQRAVKTAGTIGMKVRFLAAAAVLATALGLFSGGDAHAARSDVWYPCYISGHGWMMCMDIN